MPQLPLTGGCNCGAVRYEVTAPLVGASYCHCRRCQRRSGAAASPNAHPAPDTFRIVSGEDRLRAWKPEGSGEKWFCGDCGSSLFARNPAHADPIGIRMGTFDDDPGIRPTVHQFVRYAAPWEPIPDDGLPRFPESRHVRPRAQALARPLQAPTNGAIHVAFAIGPHFDVIDVAGPWEVFQDVRAESGGQSPFQLFTVAESTDPLSATAGLTVVPHHTYDTAPQPHVIVVPAHQATDATQVWLKQAAANADLVMSVCIGAYIIAQAGLLDGLEATTHHGFHADFESSFPRVKLVRDKRYVEHDRIATAAGLTSGIDLALRVVERYLGREAATETARYMEHESKAWLAP